MPTELSAAVSKLGMQRDDGNTRSCLQALTLHDVEKQAKLPSSRALIVKCVSQGLAAV